MMFYRDTWIEVDLDAFRHNVEYYRRKDPRKLILVLKANAYGHGDKEIAACAHSLGIDFFAVSSLDEALHLRGAGIKGDILILGYTAPAQAPIARDNGITLCVPSLEFVSGLGANAQGLRVHLKIDTGMSRIGLRDPDEVQAALTGLDRAGAKVTGIFSHYAASDSPDEEMSHKQFAAFRRIVESSGRKYDYVHIANTDGITAVSDDFTNAIRLGLGAYGYSNFIELEPCLRLYTRLAVVKKVPKGTAVSYGMHYITPGEAWIGTVPIGYADGLVRANEGACAYIGADPVPFVGRICMDQAMLKLPKEFPVGTQVEVIGPHADLRKAAKRLNTIPYEVLTLLSDRIPRIYRRNGKTVATDLARFAENK